MNMICAILTGVNQRYNAAFVGAEYAAFVGAE